MRCTNWTWICHDSNKIYPYGYIALGYCHHTHTYNTVIRCIDTECNNGEVVNQINCKVITDTNEYRHTMNAVFLFIVQSA